jgi:DNA-binding protein H-NS
LDRLPVANLVAVAVAAEERRHARAEEARQTLLQEFEDRAREMGLSLEQVFPVLAYRRGKGTGGSGVVKYRGPHGETWSGRGRLPRWLSSLEGEGRNREEFRVPSE